MRATVGRLLANTDDQTEHRSLRRGSPQAPFGSTSLPNRSAKPHRIFNTTPPSRREIADAILMAQEQQGSRIGQHRIRSQY